MMSTTQEHRERVLAHQETCLLRAIGIGKLTEYFEYLDTLRNSGTTNMYAAGSFLRHVYRGMAPQESQVIIRAWMAQSLTLPAEDRACNVIDEVQT